MKMIGKATVRVGKIMTEVEAAKLYDFISIMTHGLSAKTNFDYNIGQILAFMDKFFSEEDDE